MGWMSEANPAGPNCRLGSQDSNLDLTAPKAGGLPLHHSPVLYPASGVAAAGREESAVTLAAPDALQTPPRAS
jgi:hypothetical protein